MATIIAAIAANRAIGYQNNLVITDPLDMQMFKLTTTGSTVIMGRKTADSLPDGYLDSRNNIIITSAYHKPPMYRKTISYSTSLENALTSAREQFVIGGASIYKEAIDNPLVTKMILTEYEFTPEHADTFFPEISDSWQLTKSIPYMAIIKQSSEPVYAAINTYRRK